MALFANERSLVGITWIRAPNQRYQQPNQSAVEGKRLNHISPALPVPYHCHTSDYTPRYLYLLLFLCLLPPNSGPPFMLP
jgi:hypothetical protein